MNIDLSNVVEKHRFADENDFLRLVSAQIVLKVLNDSINVLEKSSSSSSTGNNDSETNDDRQKKSAAAASKENTSTTAITKDINENYVIMRKHFNIKRWHCISRPQYKFSCGISSLVSCWNYLYSTLGYGKLKPLSQEDALRILGYQAPFDQIRFGPFTGNKTLMKWFKILNKHFKVSGRPSFFYKPVEPNRTMGITSDMALERLRTLLKSKNHAFIYHCYNHYFCPVGFEREPCSQEQIYSYTPTTTTTTNNTTTNNNNNNSKSNFGLDQKARTSDPDQFIEWILVAETSRKYPAFHCFKWDDIDRDLCSRSPDYVNIRKLERGVQTRGATTNNKNSSQTQTQTTTNENPNLTEAIAENITPLADVSAGEIKTTSSSGKRQRARRVGENLHCLMMFQSFDSSPWRVQSVQPPSSSDIQNSATSSQLKSKEVFAINFDELDDNDDDDDDDDSSSSSDWRVE